MQRKLITIAGCVLLALGGISAIVFSREYFARLILGAASRATLAQTQATKYKVVQVYYPSDSALLCTPEQIDMHKDRVVLVDQLVRAWLSQLASQRVTLESRTLQAASIAQPGGIVLLSFNGPLLREDWSSKQKILCLQSLSKTLQGLNVRAVQLLCNHETMSDVHIDLSAPLPVDD